MRERRRVEFEIVPTLTVSIDDGGSLKPAFCPVAGEVLSSSALLKPSERAGSAPAQYLICLKNISYLFGAKKLSQSGNQTCGRR